MATLQTQSTKGAPVTVTYPAVKPSGYSNVVCFRIGKKSVSPAYTDANLPHLVQFHRGQRIVTFMLSDVLQTSYWQKIRGAYNVLGQLDIDAETKVSPTETERVVQWLKEQSSALEVTFATQPDVNQTDFAPAEV